MDLALIEDFVICTCLCRTQSVHNHKTLKFVCGHLLEHPRKLWYGNPIQVWTTVKSPSAFILAVGNIQSRVVMLKALYHLAHYKMIHFMLLYHY